MQILIIDDSDLIRDGIKSLLTAQGHDVIGEAANGQEGLPKALASQPDLVLLDMRMPHMDGLATTRELRRLGAKMAIVVLTATDTSSELFEGIKLGADGYLLKDFTLSELNELLAAIEKGHTVIRPRLAGRMLHEFGGRAIDGLSPLDVNVLRSTADGLSVSAVAAQLHITTDDVLASMRRSLSAFHRIFAA